MKHSQTVHKKFTVEIWKMVNKKVLSKSREIVTLTTWKFS